MALMPRLGNPELDSYVDLLWCQPARSRLSRDTQFAMAGLTCVCDQVEPADWCEKCWAMEGGSSKFAMPTVSRGFFGRRSTAAVKLPPGQYLPTAFPRLSAR